MKQISLRLPDDLAEQITETRGDVPQNTWIVRAIEAALGPVIESHSELRARIRPALGKGPVQPRPKGKR